MSIIKDTIRRERGNRGIPIKMSQTWKHTKLTVERDKTNVITFINHILGTSNSYDETSLMNLDRTRNVFIFFRVTRP